MYCLAVLENHRQSPIGKRMVATGIVESILSMATLATGAVAAEFTLQPMDGLAPAILIAVGDKKTPGAAGDWISVPVVGPEADVGSVGLLVASPDVDNERITEVLGHASNLIEEHLDAGLERMLLSELSSTLHRHDAESRQRMDRLRTRNVELAWTASIDGLTGLHNRDAIHAALREFSATQQETAVIIIDLDGFKAVNDTHGHLTGDEVLCAVANRVKSCLEPADIAGRLGGDEFIVILPGPISTAEARVRTKALWSALRSTYDLADIRVTIDVSIGFALSAPGQTTDELLQTADDQMYAHKRLRAVSA